MLNYCVYKCTKKNDSWITFVHGAGGSSAIWFKQIRFFSKYFMKKIIVFCLALFIFFGCSQKNENVSMEDKKIYEFSWCSYKDSFKPQDLNNELT